MQRVSVLAGVATATHLVAEVWWCVVPWGSIDASRDAGRSAARYYLGGLLLDLTKSLPSLQLVSSTRCVILLVFQVPLFKELDDHFLRALSLRLVSYTICPNQLVVHASDLSTEMYLIRRCVYTF